MNLKQVAALFTFPAIIFLFFFGWMLYSLGGEINVKKGKTKAVRGRTSGTLFRFMRYVRAIVENTVSRIKRAVVAFFDKHDRIDALARLSLIPGSITATWVTFALLIGIRNDIVRPIAIWIFLITLITLGAAKDYSEKSAFDAL